MCATKIAYVVASDWQSILKQDEISNQELEDNRLEF